MKRVKSSHQRVQQTTSAVLLFPILMGCDRRGNLWFSQKLCRYLPEDETLEQSSFTVKSRECGQQQTLSHGQGRLSLSQVAQNIPPCWFDRCRWACVPVMLLFFFFEVCCHMWCVWNGPDCSVLVSETLSKSLLCTHTRRTITSMLSKSGSTHSEMPKKLTLQRWKCLFYVKLNKISSWASLLPVPLSV